MIPPNPMMATSGGPGTTAQSDAADPRPLFRVAIFGLAYKFQRLTEIVLRHARHNRYRYVLAPSRGPGEYDIALVDMTVKGGPEVASTLRRLPSARPVVRVGRRQDAHRGQDDLLQAGFTIELLSTLNRVVEDALLGPPGPGRAGGDASPMVEERGVPRRPRALIVDDSPTVRRQLAVALHRMGVDSEGAGNAQQARECLAARRYELAFVDVVMPDVDGFRLTRELKRDPALRAMPVVILTSRSSPIDLARGALAGCNSYLVKPVSIASLRDTVSRHVRRSLDMLRRRAG